MRLGFFSLLTLILIVLKLLEVIAISWFWVVSPLLVAPLWILFLGILVAILEMMDKKERSNG